MENVVVSIFHIESEAFQAFSELKQFGQTENTKLAQASIVKAENGVVNVKDSFDLMNSLGDDYFKGGLIGSLIGILGGPLGVLFGFATGGAIGASVGSDKELINSALITTVSKKLTNGEVAIIALVQENDESVLNAIFEKYQVNGVIHLAAESHVDRSIKDPFSFAQTNVMGTLSMLQAAKLAWEGHFDDKLFYHVSTDEVYGALQPGKELFTEKTKYDPHSPYSASKASSDHFVRAYHDTYGLPVKISNCSNNYGSYQFPEKLIPLFINNIRHNKPLPVYGKGENVRDWLFVEDHARAIDLIFHKGKVGDTYNIGGFNEWKNIDLIKVLIKVTDCLLGRPEGASDHLITYVTDRAGHDLRYAIDSTKLKNELGWEPSLQFEEGIEKTVKWYLENQEWLDNVTSGDYQKYYEMMYK